MCVCMYVCEGVCMCECVCVCMCVYVCICVYKYVFKYVCMYMCECLCMCLDILCEHLITSALSDPPPLSFSLSLSDSLLSSLSLSNSFLSSLSLLLSSLLFSLNQCEFKPTHAGSSGSSLSFLRQEQGPLPWPPSRDSRTLRVNSLNLNTSTAVLYV